MQHTVHAVLFRTHLDQPFPQEWLIINRDHTIERIKLEHSTVLLEDVYNVAMQYQVTHVWIHPTCGLLKIDDEGEPFHIFATYADGDEYDQSGHLAYRGEKQLPKFARIYKSGVYGQIQVGWVEHGNWGWVYDDPVSILGGIHYLEHFLGIPVEWSPGHMGTHLVQCLNRSARRAEWVRDASINLFELPFKDAGRDILWKKPITSDRQVRYLHQYDKRSAYLAACADLYVGAGDPVHWSRENERAIDTTLPGIYRVAIESKDEVYDDRLLPEVIPAAQEWVTTDVLSFAQRGGYHLRILEAWQWEEKHKTLASYAEKLWRGRKAFRENTMIYHNVKACINAENTMKEIALVSTGKFASQKSGAFQQPYWWAAVVGRARVIMLSNISKALLTDRAEPRLIYSDSVYFLSTEADPYKAVPSIFECGKKDGLGQFRHVGSWVVTPELEAMFNDPRRTPGKIVTYLNRTWEGYEHGE